MSITSIVPPGYWIAGAPVYCQGKEIRNPADKPSLEFLEKQLIEKNELRAKILIRKIIDCPATRELYELANSKNDGPRSTPWKVEFVTRRNGSPNLDLVDNRKGYTLESAKNSRGVCDSIARTIFLNEDLSEEAAFSILVFELTNAIQQDKFKKICDDAFKKKIDRETFVKLHLEVEYEGAKLHHNIITNAIKYYNFSSDVDFYADYAKITFVIYFQMVQSTFHANYYRHAYQKLLEEKKKNEKIISYVDKFIAVACVYLIVAIGNKIFFSETPT